MDLIQTFKIQLHLQSNSPNRKQELSILVHAEYIINVLLFEVVKYTTLNIV